MSKNSWSLSDKVGVYGYGLFKEEIDELLISDDEWDALQVRF